MKHKNLNLLLSLVLLACNLPAFADEDRDDDDYKPCPVEYYNQPYEMANGTVVDDPAVLNRTIDEEFGTGAQAITHCLRHRRGAKVLVAINGAHPSNKAGVTQTNKARFLSNFEYFRENYEDVHGMKIGKDLDVVVVSSGSGGLLMTTHHPAWMRDKTASTDADCPMKPVTGKTCSNPFRHIVERAQQTGVKFYLCQMAARVLGIKMGNKIPGVRFVPGGHIAVADFQMDGYALIDL